MSGPGGVQSKNPEYFSDWIPQNIKTAFCEIPLKDQQTSATYAYMQYTLSFPRQN